MKHSELIQTNKEKILPELYEWAETFIGELDDDEEITDEPHNFVYGLAEKLEKNQCTENDYDDILFHIEQINYNEIKIAI